MRLILLLLSVNFIFAEDNGVTIKALTQNIVGLDQDGIEKLNTSLGRENAGLSLINSNGNLGQIDSASQQNQTLEPIQSESNSNQSTTNTISVSDSVTLDIGTSQPVSLSDSNSTSSIQETTDNQICLVPYIPWSGGLFFLSEYKGEDPRIVKIMEKWAGPIDFYVKYGIGTLPTELNQEINDSGIEVVYDKSLEELSADIESGQCGAPNEGEDSIQSNTTNSSDVETSATKGIELEKLASEDIPILKNI